MLVVAGALEDGVDVGSDLGESSGDGGDDAGTVVDDETEIVGRDEVAGDAASVDGEFDRDAALGDG